MIRKTIAFVFAVSLVIAGGYILYLQFFFSTEINSLYLSGAGIFGFIGLAWIWEDYLAPLLNKQGQTTDE